MTPLGKQFVCLVGAAVCFVVALLIPGLRDACTVAGWAGVVGVGLSAWIIRKPASSCSRRAIYDSPSGEVRIGVCHDCEGWLVGIRGDVKRTGRGREPLIVALRELGDSHAQPLPEIAAELREAADRIESFDPEEGLRREFMRPVVVPVEGAENEVASALIDVVGEERVRELLAQREQAR